MRILLAILLLLSTITHAQQKRLALVIGNGKYQFGGTLKNPVNDAEAMGRKLKELGFEVMSVTNATQSTMKRAIDEFGQKLSGYDAGLFYYAGHGIQVKGRNYMIPVEADIKIEQQVEYDCIAADRVLAFMEAAGTKVNLIFLDACRNNPYERSWSRTTSGSGLAFMNAPTGTLISYATSPGNVADDGTGENGLYTSVLLKHMSEPNLTIEQMLKRVRTDVETASEKRQTPWESTSLTGDFYFNYNASAPRGDVIKPAPMDYYEELAATRGRTDRALVIGTSDYDEWIDLVNPVQDANTIAYELARNFGFKVETMINPSKRELLQTLRSYAGVEGDPVQYNPNDQLFIYISGHGQFDDKERDGYLVCKESRINDESYGSYLPFSILRTILNNIKVKHLMVFLDVSTGAPLYGQRVLDSTSMKQFASSAEQQSYASDALRFKSRVTINSGGKQYVPDGRPGRHAPLTDKFLQVLKKGNSDVTVITSENIGFSLKSTVKPLPYFSNFGGNEPGGEFVFQSTVKK